MTTPYTATGFFCENVLMDTENRQSLIGIFPSQIKLPEFPWLLPLGLFVRIMPIPPANDLVRIRLCLNGEDIFHAEAPHTPPADTEDPSLHRALHLGLKQIIVNLPAPGLLEAKVNIGDSQEIMAAVVKIAPANG